MKWRKRTCDEIAEMICGEFRGKLFPYRTSSVISRFFRDADTDYVHDGSTRAKWVSDTLEDILALPHDDSQTPPVEFYRVIRLLMDQGDATDEDPPPRVNALKALNVSLSREGFEAFYGEDKLCYLRHVRTNAVVGIAANPHRPFTPAELARRDVLSAYLDRCSEDELIDEVLVPMLRHLRFHRITAAGHKDKSLEYGKDVWMRFQLPTQHFLYFGIQAKKGKLDAAGGTKAKNANMAEIHAQAVMMLGHEVFDPETNKKVLVDHAFIVAGGEITKAARQWLGDRLNASQRSQIIFMDRNDILNLHVANNVPLPALALPKTVKEISDEIPF
jgi:hypothetical protein